MEKLPEDNLTLCKFQMYCRLAEIRNKREPGCPEAVEDAKKALGLSNKVHGGEFEKRKMEDIIAWS